MSRAAFTIDTGLDNGVQITIRGITSTNFTETGDPATDRKFGVRALFENIDPK